MNIDHMKNIKKLICHGPNCADGKASALILHDALPEAEIVFCNYGTPEYKALTPEPGVLFCDFSPYVEREQGPKDPPMTAYGRALAQAWVDAGTIVLDHHKGCADLVALFGDRGVFADEKAEPGVSGAVLAYREVWSRIMVYRGVGEGAPVREFANLAGVRDTWQKSDPRWLESCAQAAALTFWPWEKLLEAGVFGLEPLMAIGSVLLARDAERDLKTIKESYRFTFKDVRIVCFDGLHTSDIAETLGEEADLIVGWHYACDADGPKVIFSCRSRGSRITALDFAKAHGGGGHTHAAGFTAPVSKENSSLLLVPYACVEALVGKYLIEKTA